jgi:Tol biopolymer transport system component
MERNPSFSPDGTQVVYEWEQENGQHHLYLKAVGAGDPIPLTSGSGADYGPAWSPDGKSIAFVRQDSPSASGVFVIAPVGGTARKVVDVPPFPLSVVGRPYRRLDWTRDSRHLIVSAFRPPGWECLALVSVDTGEKTWLTGPAADTMSGDREPAVSSDGTVVFARGVVGNETLYLLPLTADFRPAGAARPISAAGPARSPAWMPNGRQLIYTTLQPGVIPGFALAWINLDFGKPPRPLAALGNGAATPVFSRQGRLAYSTVSGEGNIWRQDLRFSAEGLLRPVKVSTSATLQASPEHSPDGARIALASERTGTREIWNCESDGPHCVQVTSFNGAASDSPRWSPDGKQIVFESIVAGDWDVYVVDATGGA